MYYVAVHACNHGTEFGGDGGRRTPSLRLAERHGGTV